MEGEHPTFVVSKNTQSKMMSEKTSLEKSMTPEEELIIDQKLREVAQILCNNTPKEELATFETIELSVRNQLLEKVAPK